MKIEAAKIKSWVERIEALLEERTALNGDIKDIYTEIKSGDHDAKAIRKLIQRRAQDPSELAQQDDLLSAYTDAVAGKIKALEAIERGASTKEAAKAGSISTGAVSALARDARVHNSRKLNEPQREVIPEEDSCGPGSIPARGINPSRDESCLRTPPSNAFPSTPPQPDDNTTERPALQEVGAVDNVIARDPKMLAPMSAGHTVIVNPDAEIDLTIPAHLDQRKRQVHA